jgi:hypothetical protein
MRYVFDTNAIISAMAIVCDDCVKIKTTERGNCYDYS